MSHDRVLTTGVILTQSLECFGNHHGQQGCIHGSKGGHLSPGKRKQNCPLRCYHRFKIKDKHRSLMLPKILDTLVLLLRHFSKCNPEQVSIRIIEVSIFGPSFEGLWCYTHVRMVAMVNAHYRNDGGVDLL